MVAFTLGIPSQFKTYAIKHNEDKRNALAKINLTLFCVTQEKGIITAHNEYKFALSLDNVFG